MMLKPANGARRLVAPDADHEVHREQDELEEDEEQDKVEGDERSVHTHLQDEDKDEERLGVAGLFPMVPGVDDGQHGHERRQHQHGQADAINADVIVRPNGWNPAQ